MPIRHDGKGQGLLCAFAAARGPKRGHAGTAMVVPAIFRRKPLRWCQLRARHQPLNSAQRELTSGASG